ncbi:MAG: alpha/beta hydrolase [Symbiobacteriia bacterium]
MNEAALNGTVGPGKSAAQPGKSAVQPLDIQVGDGQLQAADGTSLFFRTWRPASPRGVLVLVHGAGEHCGRFDHVARFLAGRGVAVFGYDQRGLGRSSGTRGHVERFADYLSDLQQALGSAREWTPGVPLGLYGHSMGGLVVLAYALEHPQAAEWVIATSPWLELALPVPGWQAGLARVLSRVWPSFAMPSGVPATYLAHPPAVGEAYVADPFVEKKVSARWYVELVATAGLVREAAPRFATPLLLLQAGDDHLVSAPASAAFFQRARARDKTFHLYPGLYHEIHNEPAAPEVMEQVAAWLEPRLGPASG